MKKLIFCILILFCHLAHARQVTSSAVEIGKKQSLYSNILDNDEDFNLYLPESFHEASNDHQYPVILLLENEFFHLVTGIVKHLSAVNRMPESIVVSLVNGPVVPKLYTNGSDFWPKDWKQLPFGESPADFVRHLKEELFPYLEKHYRANDYRMVIGLSGTSIFALHAMAKEPDLFDAHITIAAGDILGMGYKEGKSLIDELEQNLIQKPDLKSILYVTSADSDVQDAPMIGKNLKAMNNRLSKYAGENFKFISKIHPNESHYGVALPALGEAFNLIFPKEKWSADYRALTAKGDDAMAQIDGFYQKLSNTYGFTILPMAERWNSINSLRWLGLDLLKNGRIKEAIVVLERRVQYRPKSINALTDLSEAFERGGQLVKAYNTLEKAILVAIEKEDNSFTKLMDRLQLLRMKSSINKPLPEVSDKSKEALSKSRLIATFQDYNQIRAKVFSKGSTVSDVDSLFSFYTDSFTYNHPGYGGLYSRELLYNNTVKFLNAGKYDNTPKRHVFNIIAGLNAIIIEEQYAGSNQKTVTLYKFCGHKICYIEEYW